MSRLWMSIEDPELFYLLSNDLQGRIRKAAINTVNQQAALTRKNAIKNIQDDFTLRNDFTARQIQYIPMVQNPKVNISDIEASVGITEKADYMARQKEGGTRKATGASGVLAIPTAMARGGSMVNPVLRSKYLTKLKKFKNVSKKDKPKGFNKSWLVRKAYIASKHKLVMRYATGLVTVTDFEKTGDKVSFKMDFIYSIGKTETITPANPWLLPATEKPSRDVQKIFESHINKG